MLISHVDSEQVVLPSVCLSPLGIGSVKFLAVVDIRKSLVLAIALVVVSSDSILMVCACATTWYLINVIGMLAMYSIQLRLDTHCMSAPRV